MEHPIETNDKIRKNAISAYLMIFVSVFFLTNKANPLLANDFVKAHTKTAFLIHLAFLVVTLIFLWFGLLGSLSVMSIGINNIIASSLLLGLFGVLLYGIHKAHKGEYFTIIEVMKITKSEKMVGVTSDHTLTEKDKLAIILSYVPLLGYIIYGMHQDNETLRNITKVNLLCSLIISIIFVAGHSNLALLLTLAYIVFTVFSSIILVGKNEVLLINAEFIPDFDEIENYLFGFIKYLKGFFGKHFKKLDTVLTEQKQKQLTRETDKETYVSGLPKYKFKHFLVYVPVLNLFHIFYNKNSLYYHIANGVSISILFILSWATLGIDNKSQILLLFPIFFGLAFLETHKTYTLPFISYIGLGLLSGISGATGIFSSAKKLSKQKEEVSLKPEIK